MYGSLQKIRFSIRQFPERIKYIWYNNLYLNYKIKHLLIKYTIKFYYVYTTFLRFLTFPCITSYFYEGSVYDKFDIYGRFTIRKNCVKHMVRFLSDTCKFIYVCMCVCVYRYIGKVKCLSKYDTCDKSVNWKKKNSIRTVGRCSYVIKKVTTVW